MDIDWTDSNHSWRLHVDPKHKNRFFLDKDGYYLDSADFDSTVINPSPVHYTELVGSTDPELRIAFQFFKWIYEDKSLSYLKFFKQFGVIDPTDERDFDFIRRYAFRTKTPNRQFIRNFFKGIDSIFKRIDDHLEDLFLLRGLALSRYESHGVPVRMLTSELPPKFLSKPEWPTVNAAWVGEKLKEYRDGHSWYVVSFAICLICQNRLDNVYWYNSIEWVAKHNQNCPNTI